MSGGQPTIKVEHFHRQKSPSVPEADYRRRNSASPPSLRVTQMVGRRSSYVLCEDESNSVQAKSHGSSSHQHHNNGFASAKSSPNRSHHKHHRTSGSSRDEHARSRHTSPVHAFGSFLAPTNPNIYARRKSSPAITDCGSLPLASLLAAAGASESSSSERSTSRRHHQQQHSSRRNQEAYSPTTSPPHHLQRRRLSSPPSLDRTTQKQSHCNKCGGFSPDCYCYGDSNHSSGSNSMQMLSLSTLNTSSTDVRENTVISGHQEIQTLYAANNVVYPDSISVNLINAPGNSTVQCDCGHINCPLCNLMMNLELSSEFYK